MNPGLKWILMRLLYLMNHLCHEDTLTNSFLQVALQQQNWAASTWDLLRSIWTDRVVSFFLCLLLMFKTKTLRLFNHVHIRFGTSNLGGYHTSNIKMPTSPKSVVRYCSWRLHHPKALYDTVADPFSSNRVGSIKILKCAIFNTNCAIPCDTRAQYNFCKNALQSIHKLASEIAVKGRE